MCGRLSSKTQPQVLAQLYHARLGPEDYLPSHNVAPTERAPVVREAADHERTIDLATFGMPVTVRGAPINLINLQSEKVKNRLDFRERRCVVPADGFFEWEKVSAKDKQPHFFHPPEGLFSLAGVWSTTPRGLAFSILTTEPNELVARFHNRMPVILGHNAVSQWLAPESKPEMLAELLKPFPASLMHEYRVSKYVNNARAKDALCVVPA